VPNWEVPVGEAAGAVELGDAPAESALGKTLEFAPALCQGRVVNYLLPSAGQIREVWRTATSSACHSAV